MAAMAALVSANFQVNWYSDSSCNEYSSQQFYETNGDFGIGNSDQGCYKTGEGFNPGASIIVACPDSDGCEQASCAAYASDNCLGGKIAGWNTNGGGGNVGNSGCQALSMPVKSFDCQSVGQPL